MKEILEKLDLTTPTMEVFSKMTLDTPRYQRQDEQLYLTLYSDEVIPFKIFNEFITKLQLHVKVKVDITIETKAPWTLSFTDLHDYLMFITMKHKLYDFNEVSWQLNGFLKVLCRDSGHQEYIDTQLDKLQSYIKKYGINIEMDTDIFKDTFKEEVVQSSNVSPMVREEKDIPTKPNNNFKSNNGFRKNNNRSINKLDFKTLEIEQLYEDINNVSVKGCIFLVETRPTKNGSVVVKYYLHNGKGAIIVSGFANDESEVLKEGTFVQVYGDYVYDDRFERGFVLKLKRYDIIDNFLIRDDNAVEKRVEFHLHTNYSEMDGISNINDYLDQAMRWGMPGLVITDHCVVQSFPKAYNKKKQLQKKYDVDSFKLGYGVEMNMVADKLSVVKNGHNEPLHHGSYVVFDIETTGLSVHYDHMIEFGAVKVEDGVIVSKMQTFIKTPQELSNFTISLTNITPDLLKDAPEIKEAMNKIIEYIGDYPLVAHNASFDYDFLQSILFNLGMEPLNNAIIDTLDLTRALFTDRRSYRLGSIARFLKIGYDENVAHRADYDAEVLTMVFLKLLQDERILELDTINQLNELNNDKSFAKLRKYHLNVISKNRQGLKRLYQLVSLSHTKYLAFMGKSGGKSGEFLAEPRITKEELEKDREHLLIGAGCTESELFEIAANKSQQALEKAIQFYDYVEIMPLGLYEPLVFRNAIPTKERLIDIIQRIINAADKYNIPVLAVGDAHYNEPYEKIARDIYINAQGIGGTRHPLYIFNAEKRAGFTAPDQHFRTTEEMLDDFNYIGDRKYEFVIENPKKIFALLDDYSPKQNDLYTPKLENSDELLTQIVYDNAYKLYGDPLPEYVQKRIERELDSILKHGYGVIYYISHLLVKKSLDDGYLVGSRGSVGSSFVATMAEITEVNPLAPHYVCAKCHHNEFFFEGEYASGYDLPPKNCPNCGSLLIAEGQDIPFETFLGFEGDKVPDIDLNFSGDYQETAHNYTKEIFGEDYVYRAGTISTVAQKTAYGYALGFLEDLGKSKENNAYNTFLANMAEGVKRTTGQHPGGIIVIPNYMDVHDFTPIQYPANNPESSWFTTHYEFHDIDDNVLKLDILGHVDPTAMKFLEKITGIDVRTIPMNDSVACSLFNSAKALNVDQRYHQEITGAAGLPEFGTQFVRQMLEVTRPTKFSDLVVISGLSHGTGVWLGNAETLVSNGLTLNDVIGCRDDIMVYLMQHGLKAKAAFDIMESVRKGKGLNDDWIKLMKEHNVPTWYIDSCLKIKYMFPKAHAVAYVMMALRIAWFKVYHPLAYYAAYFTLRCNAYEIETMVKDRDVVSMRLNSISQRLKDFNTKRDVTAKEKSLIDTLEITLEMINRGYHINPINLELSQATEFILDPNDDKGIIPPFNVVDGLGDNVAKTIVNERNKQKFISKKDLMSRCGVSTTTIKKLDELKVTDHLQETNQMSLF